MLNENHKIDNKITQSEPLLTKEPDIPLWKRLTLFGTSMFCLFILPLLAYIMVLGVPKEQKDSAINFICYGIMFVLMFAIIVVDIPKYISKFKNWANYLIGFGFGVAIILFDIAYINLARLHPAYGLNQNESTIRNSLNFYPALQVIFLGIIGPITEELAHRAGVFKSLSKVNKILAYIVSSLIFAFLHFGWTNPNYITEWINFPLYVVSGAVLAFAYDKYSIVASSTAHITNNLYSVIIPMIVTGVIHA